MIFTNDWFVNSDVKNKLHMFLDSNKSLKMLEIGCYEGASTCFFSNFLENENSTLDCVDPFDTKDTTSPVYENMENVFMENIKSTKNEKKITLYKMYSNEFYKRFEKKQYDFIYIDGSHLPEDIIIDMINCFKILKINGIIWMDDYLGGSYGDMTIKNTIDKVFYENFKDCIEIVHTGYQIAFKKILELKE